MLSATCGTCGGKHETIADYRECAGAKTEAQEATGVMDKLAGPKTVNPPSDAQVKYCLDLLRMKDWPDSYTDADLRSMERRQVSKLIDELGKATIKLETIDVPSGWYALQRPDESWGFWQVDTPLRGKWAGFSFVSQLIGSPGDYRKQKVSKNVAQSIIDQIKEITPKVAFENFGKQSGTCGICHSPLSNKDSLERGIGPVCADKMGW